MYGWQQITNYYTNHQSVPKEDDSVPIKIGKQWNAHLVVDYLWHEEIAKAVNDSGITDPHQWIAEWSKATSEKYESLPESEKARYAVLAEEWKKKGLPLKVKQRLVFSVRWCKLPY